MTPRPLAAVLVLLCLAAPARAQDRGTLNPQPLPPLAHPDDPKTPARELFGRKTHPTAGAPHVYGFYSHGCIAGAEALPINGPTWQVMRLSRNRNWGHPKLIKFLERLSARAAKMGWPGLLVGDMAQPRGGPMITGHASHQVGLAADIWLTPMPYRTPTRDEREDMSATMSVDAGAWRRHQGGGRGSCGRAHLRQCGDQEGAVPRGRRGSRLAREGAALLGARLSLPRPPDLSDRQSDLQAARSGAAGRRLQPRARL